MEHGDAEVDLETNVLQIIHHQICPFFSVTVINDTKSRLGLRLLTGLRATIVSFATSESIHSKIQVKNLRYTKTLQQWSDKNVKYLDINN